MRKLKALPLLALILLSLVLSVNVPAYAQTTSRFLFIRNFENANFNNEPLLAVLAFPDNTVTQTDLANMRILDGATEQPYQVEKSTVYPSGYVKSANLWVNCAVAPLETKALTVTFESTPPSYGSFGTFNIANNFVNVTTNAYQKISIATDAGLCWVSLITANGTQILKNPESKTATNGVFDIRNQAYEAAVTTTPDKQIRYATNIANPCSVTIEQGALFAKVFWNSTDSLGKTHDGWIRFWKDNPWIEFFTNGTAPVNSTYPQAYVGYRIDSSNAQGTSLNNGTLNYVLNSASTVAMTQILYTQPTNYYGETTVGYGTKFYAEALASGVNRIHYRERLANFTTFDGSAIAGKLGVPCAFITFSSDGTSTLEALNRYYARPVASYYCASDEATYKTLITQMFRDFLTQHGSEFLASQQDWNFQLIKAYASFVLLDVDADAKLENFVSYLQAYTPSTTSWLNDASTFSQTIPNFVTASYHVYKKTGDTRILPEMERILNTIADYHQTVKSINDFYNPVNKRKAVIEMMNQFGELFPENSNASLIKTAMATENNYLYNSTEAFNVYGLPKYQTIGQGYNTPSDRSMNTLTSTNYIINVNDIKNYESLDYASWLRSYTVLQNAAWNRLGDTRDDYMLEYAHNPQDRLFHASSFTAWLRTYLYLPTSEYVAGTSSVILSYQYLNSLRTNAYIPFASNYALSYQNNTWNYAETLKTMTISAGWYSDVGVFDAALLALTDETAPTYSNLQHNPTTTDSTCGFTSTWNDDYALSGYIFASNISGTMQNNTWSAFTSSPATVTVHQTLPPDADRIIAYVWYVNDTSGNWATATAYFVTTPKLSGSGYTGRWATPTPTPNEAEPSPALSTPPPIKPSNTEFVNDNLVLIATGASLGVIALYALCKRR